MSLELQVKTKKELTDLAHTISRFNLSKIASVNKQLLDTTEGRVNFGMVLENYIKQAELYNDQDLISKFSRTKNLYDLFIKTLNL